MAEIDELIEEGLNLYGQGDLDGALLAWERALVVDPENAQANSYVDYVRMNYDLLTGQAQSHESQAPFGIDDEPYQIEILPAEAAHLNPGEQTKQTRTRTQDMDAGWFMDEEKSQPNRTLELQADEPPPAPPVLPAEPVLQETTVNFEDQTREYQKDARPPVNEFANVELTPGVDSAAGFSAQTTGIRERDTGFVRATTRPDTSGGAGARAKRPSQAPPEAR